MYELVEEVRERTVSEPYGFVYITINMVNGKKYLGQRKFSDGWEDYLGSGKMFKQAVEKYGKENFKRVIVQFCYSEEELNDVEYKLSVDLNAVKSKDWYNMVYGGGTTTGWDMPQETRDKIGVKTKERLSDKTNHPCYGKPGLIGEKNPMFGVSPKERMDEETYQRWYDEHIPYWQSLKEKNKGKHLWGDGPNPNSGQHLSDEQKENLSKKAKERYKNQENHPMYGKHHSEESRNKMSEAKKGKVHLYKCKPVYCIELNKCFYAATYAEGKLNISAQGIGKCCMGKQHTAGKHPETNEPLHWIYAEDAIKKGYITKEQVDECLNKLKTKGDDSNEN